MRRSVRSKTATEVHVSAFRPHPRNCRADVAEHRPNRNENTGGKNWGSWITCALASIATVAQVEAAILVIENADPYDEEIVEVYVAPIDVSAWGPNRISQPIPAGEYIEIDLDSLGDAICMFDIRIVEDDSDEYIYQMMNLCRSPILTLE